MVNAVTDKGHQRIQKSHHAQTAQCGTAVHHAGAACADKSSRTAENCHKGADNNNLLATELPEQRQQNQQGGSHRSHGNHGELGLNGSKLAVGVSVYDPARVVDLRNALHCIRDLIQKDHDDQHDPILVLDAGTELLHKGGFLDLYCFCLTGHAVLVAAFLGDALAGVEILYKG